MQAQKLMSDDAIEISKGYLYEYVGPDLIRFFDFAIPNSSYYVFDRNQPLTPFEPDKKLKKNFSEIWIQWNFSYPEFGDSSLWVKLNADLELLESIDLDFIPEYVWKNESDEFISVAEAEAIGDSILKKTEFGRSEPRLTFDKEKYKYIYTIENRLSNKTDIFGKDRAMVEILEIDAVTGEPFELIKSEDKLIMRYNKR
ncbi:hypothetical protein DMZ48_03465 [Robertkochia solimangrovi]|nr:hypothetical protein DMZ48_03465 [Robertkochia solimangrovi]